MELIWLMMGVAIVLDSLFGLVVLFGVAREVVRREQPAALDSGPA